MSILDLLPLYAVGALDDHEAREVEHAIAADPALARELGLYRDVTAELATALPGVSPSAAVRSRLLASAAPRFERFTARFAELFDVAADRARELLGLIDRQDAWEPGPGPGSWLIHFQAGPAFAGADTGFVRLAPGQRFNWHRHDGKEHNLVLAGRAHDTLFGEIGPGDEAVAEPGSEHEFTALGDDDYIFAVWVWGVDFTVPRPPR